MSEQQYTMSEYLTTRTDETLRKTLTRDGLRGHGLAERLVVIHRAGCPGKIFCVRGGERDALLLHCDEYAKIRGLFFFIVLQHFATRK